MPMTSNSLNKRTKYGGQLLLAIAFLFLLILSAKLSIDLGIVNFTFQTLMLGLAYYFLERKWRLAIIAIYLGLGIVGLKVFSGGVGWSYFTSQPLGFFIGFVVVAFLPRSSPKFLNILLYFIQLHLIIVVLGLFNIVLIYAPYYDTLMLGLKLLPGLIIKSLLGSLLVFYVHHRLRIRPQ
jgi:biotin transporter BioY